MNEWVFGGLGEFFSVFRSWELKLIVFGISLHFELHTDDFPSFAMSDELELNIGDFITLLHGRFEDALVQF